MANEVTKNTNIQVSKSSAGIQIFRSFADQADMAGNHFNWKIQTVGTSAEAVDIGDIGTVGQVVAFNQDGTNYVELSTASDGTGPLARIPAGKHVSFYASTNTFYAKAHTASCLVEFLIVEA